jgi:hypothetical protein
MAGRRMCGFAAASAGGMALPHSLRLAELQLLWQ